VKVTALRIPVIVVVALMVLTGCDWVSFGYSAARTRYNNTETAITVANVSDLTKAWEGSDDGTPRAATASPAVAHGIAYISVAVPTPNQPAGRDIELRAYDARGSTSCDGLPKVCRPLWTASLGDDGGGPHLASVHTPAVSDGVVFVTNRTTLYAFDASGTAGCSGEPKVCAPLWNATLTTAYDTYTYTPTVAGGIVYVVSGDRLYAFDAAGVAGCSGVPKVCAPRWTGPVTASIGAEYSSPVVAGGMVYAPGSRRVHVFDARGEVGCSGTPVSCTPIWSTAPDAGPDGYAVTAAVTGGRLYVDKGDRIDTYDATGSIGCGGAPKTCGARWSYPGNGNLGFSAIAIANGVLYSGGNQGSVLAAFDASGVSGCSGTPKLCAPLWTSTVRSGVRFSAPAIANGVAFIGGDSPGVLYAFDASGAQGCSGAPRTCEPLWSSPAIGRDPGDPVFSSPAVANGTVYIGTDATGIVAFE